MKNKNEYLGVPIDEKIVPFPNFGSVLLQHAREFPDKIALQFKNRNYSYKALLEECLSLPLSDKIVQLSFMSIENDLIILLSCLCLGIPFKLDFKGSSNLILKDLEKNEIQIKYFEPPYVRLDDKAFILNENYEFSQYNVLVASQAIGNAFKLFRDGAAYCPENISSITDLVFGVLGPLYFAKSIYFTFNDNPDFYQYAWNRMIKSDLRDAVMVTNHDSNHKNIFRLKNSFEQALGLGKVISPNGKGVVFLGFELDNDVPKGHCLGNQINDNE